MYVFLMIFMNPEALAVLQMCDKFKKKKTNIIS